VTSPAPLAEALAAQAAYQAAPALTLLPGGAAGAALSLAERQAQARLRIASTTLRLVTGEYAAVADPRDPEAIAAAARATFRLIQGGQSATANSTAAYLRAVLSQITSRHIAVTAAVAGTIALGATLRKVTDPESVYYRAFEQWRYARSIGAPEPEAKAAGLDRLERQVSNDLGMAMRSAAYEVLDGTDEAIGYRRLVRPEMTSGGPCGLCLVAADRLYRTSELMPLHTHCACDVMPVTREHDPGRELNTDDLFRIYEVAGSNRATDLAKVRVRVTDHGELGPVLRAA
jgi:hypothetical protein